MSTAIEAHGLTKRYGRTVAVDDLSFRVDAGRVTGFVGPNGAGKSTTMRLILGLDAADAGDVRVGGRRYRDLSRAASRGRGASRRGRDASREARAQPSPVAREEQPPAVQARGRGPRARRPLRSRTQADGRLLAGDDAAAGHRGCHARRPAGAPLRRADQRARSRRHPLDPRLPASARRRGTRRARVEPPDGRARGHRRRARRHRARPADRPDERRASFSPHGPTGVSTSGRLRSPR